MRSYCNDEKLRLSYMQRCIYKTWEENRKTFVSLFLKTLMCTYAYLHQPYFLLLIFLTRSHDHNARLFSYQGERHKNKRNHLPLNILKILHRAYKFCYSFEHSDNRLLTTYKLVRAHNSLLTKNPPKSGSSSKPEDSANWTFGCEPIDTITWSTASYR